MAKLSTSKSAQSVISSTCQMLRFYSNSFHRLVIHRLILSATIYFYKQLETLNSVQLCFSFRQVTLVMKLTFVILHALAYLSVAQCAEILCIFPRPAYSHQAVFRAVTEKLLARGHKLTLMTTHPSESEKLHENVTLIEVSFSVEVFQKALDEVYESKSFLDAIYRMVDTESFLTDQQLSSDGMQKLIKNREHNFELLLIETCGMSPFHALAEHFKVPVVGITSADAFSIGHEIMGNVANPISHPDRVLPFTFAETFKQRLVSCIFNLFMRLMIIPRAEANNEPIVRKHFPEVTKSYNELVSNVDLQLINAHPALGYLRPIVPNTIPLGFLHIKPPKPLPSELQDLLDNSKHGVIFMSFGTVVTQKLAGKNIENFMKVFAELPFDVFWKIDDDSTFESVPANVHLQKWFPQSDLLAHPNVKLFITHGVS